jgi:hypothetical protein
MFRHYVMDFKRLFNVISRNNSEVAENDPLRRGSAADPGGRGYGPAVRRMPRLVSHPRTFRHPRESGDPVNKSPLSAARHLTGYRLSPARRALCRYANVPVIPAKAGIQ